MNKLSRRNFLKRSALASIAGAAGSEPQSAPSMFTGRVDLGYAEHRHSIWMKNYRGMQG